MKLKVGRVYKYVGTHPSYAALNIFYTRPAKLSKRSNYRGVPRVQYFVNAQIKSGETFVVLDTNQQGDYLVITFSERVGYIFASHVNLPYTSWTEVRIPDEENP